MDKANNQQARKRSIVGRLSTALATSGLLSFVCLAGISTVSTVAFAREQPVHLEEGGMKWASRGFIPPFANGRISSGFNQGRAHPAIDLAGPLGTPVVATSASQRVAFAGRRGGYGNAVITRDAQVRTHLYGHLQTIATRVGQVLKQGQKLGTLGSTGFSTGPHVHYEVKNTAGRHVDPRPLLFPRRTMHTG